MKWQERYWGGLRIKRVREVRRSPERWARLYARIRAARFPLHSILAIHYDPIYSVGHGVFEFASHRRPLVWRVVLDGDKGLRGKAGGR